jgi:exopolyphosphatase / guanosine-5'-triphosphate,3'-diphosphate pyrophosphatase
MVRARGRSIALTVAAIDIGSNSIRILVIDDTGREILRLTEVTGLGRGVDRSGVMSDAAVAETLRVIRGFAAIVRSHGVDRVGAVATSACRDAANGEAVIGDIGDILGVIPDIIGGSREAGLSFAGATSDLRDERPRVVVDIGGGSTEVVQGDGHTILWAHSYDIGSVRLTDRALPDRPATRHQLDAASNEVDRVLCDPPVEPRCPDPIGVAGTFTSLAGIHLGLASYDRAVVHGTILSRGDIASLISDLAAMTVEQTAAIPSLEPRRAPVILAGAVVADRALDALEADQVVVSERDLLDGLAAELAAS